MPATLCYLDIDRVTTYERLVRRAHQGPLRVLATSVLVLSAGCSSDSAGPGPTGQPGILVLNRPANDTVEATPIQAVVVQVGTPSGAPAAGAVVRFEALLVNAQSADYGLTVSALGGTGFGALGVDTTDAQGQAAIRVRMGRIATAVSLAVKVPLYGFEDTVTFTIAPGRPHSIRFLTRDTAVATGRTAPLPVVVRDRLDNQRTGDPVTYTVLSGQAAVAGNVATGTAFGRARIVVRVGTLADTMHLSVMPHGTIAAWTTLDGQKLTILQLELDGTGLREITSSNPTFGFPPDMALTWSADRSKLYFHDSPTDINRQLWVYDIASATRTRLVAPAQQLEFEAYPRLSSDGWVYFNGGDYYQQNAHRVRVDGSGLERLAFPRSLDPAPSPDGTRVVSVDEFAELQILNLATGAVTRLPVTGLMPLWAPGGNEILYIATPDTYDRLGQLRAVRPDGTGDRLVSTDSLEIQGPFSFSPDGKYIVARGAGVALAVIDYATGVSAHLISPAFDRGFNSPMWK